MEEKEKEREDENLRAAMGYVASFSSSLVPARPLTKSPCCMTSRHANSSVSVLIPFFVKRRMLRILGVRDLTDRLFVMRDVCHSQN